MCVLTRSLLQCKQADELLSTARRLCSITQRRLWIDESMSRQPPPRQAAASASASTPTANQHTHHSSISRNSPSHHPNNAHNARVRGPIFLPPDLANITAHPHASLLAYLAPSRLPELCTCASIRRTLRTLRFRIPYLGMRGRLGRDRRCLVGRSRLRLG